jgi:hypothetical protein
VKKRETERERERDTEIDRKKSRGVCVWGGGGALKARLCTKIFKAMIIRDKSKTKIFRYSLRLKLSLPISVGNVPLTRMRLLRRLYKSSD